MADPLKDKGTEEKLLVDRDFDVLVQDVSYQKDTTCGYSFFRPQCLQRFASTKVYVICHGLISCIIFAQYSYYNSTLTTMEKRFQISSQDFGKIMGGSSIVSCFMTPLMSHFLSRKHKPHWMAFGVTLMAVYCFMTAALHFIYGPGDDALSLTKEYEELLNRNSSLGTSEMTAQKICIANVTEIQIRLSDSSRVPQYYLFGVKIFSGFFTSIFTVLGQAYLDDNLMKSKTPIMISFSYFITMLGPLVGSGIASFALKTYVDPSLTPIITPKDSRWIGAWWLGWITLGIILLFSAFPLSLFPKVMPRAKVRQMILAEKRKENGDEKTLEVKLIPSLKRITTNKIYMLNTIAGIFYVIGFYAYWLYMAKYIETQYRQTASYSAFLAGSYTLLFSALGLMVSGWILSKYKPSARIMAAWNVIGGILTISIILVYTFIPCDANDSSIIVNQPVNENFTTCISNCNCDFVKFSPVCGEDENTYISPCHAGCTEQSSYENGTKYYSNCGCIKSTEVGNVTKVGGGYAYFGSCLVNCNWPLLIYMIMMAVKNFLSSSGRACNFLIGIRCVNPEDKAVSMGFEKACQSLFGYLPTPIVVGKLIDMTCMVWGKTTTGNGNCWLYDGKSFRYSLNFFIVSFVSIGILIDSCVWYYVKNLKIFDDNEADLFTNIVGENQNEDVTDTVEMKIFGNDMSKDKIVK